MQKAPVGPFRTLAKAVTFAGFSFICAVFPVHGKTCGI
jgi:hypothetical protein